MERSDTIILGILGILVLGISLANLIFTQKDLATECKKIAIMILKQRINKLFGIKGPEVIYFFAHADIL